MSNSKTEKVYDLEERTFKFAKSAIGYFRKIPKTISNIEIAKQGIRSSGSVGANFIEANEALSKKDFIMRIKICRKEAKETIYWAKLSECLEIVTEEKNTIIREATELMKIFGSIIEKSKS